MKKLPRKIKIGAHTYKVISNSVHNEFAGETDREARTIFINKNLNETEKFATLIHEIFHVMNSTLAGTRDGHSLIDSLSEQLAQVLLDNKLIIK